MSKRLNYSLSRLREWVADRPGEGKGIRRNAAREQQSKGSASEVSPRIIPAHPRSLWPLPPVVAGHECMAKRQKSFSKIQRGQRELFFLSSQFTLTPLIHPSSLKIHNRRLANAGWSSPRAKAGELQYCWQRLRPQNRVRVLESKPAVAYFCSCTRPTSSPTTSI